MIRKYVSGGLSMINEEDSVCMNMTDSASMANSYIKLLGGYVFEERIGNSHD